MQGCRLCAIESSVRQLEGRGLVPSACFRGLCPQTGQGPLAEQGSCSAPRIRAPHNHPSLLLHPFQLAVDRAGTTYTLSNANYLDGAG